MHYSDAERTRLADNFKGSDPWNFNFKGSDPLKGFKGSDPLESFWDLIPLLNLPYQGI